MSKIDTVTQNLKDWYALVGHSFLDLDSQGNQTSVEPHSISRNHVGFLDNFSTRTTRINNTEYVDMGSYSNGDRSIQAAIDTVAARGGGTVVVSPGTRKEALTLPSKVQLVGSGVSDPNLDQSGTTIRRPDSHDGPVITIEDPGTQSGRVFAAGVQNLNVTGNPSNGTPPTANGHCIRVINPERVRIRDVSVWNATHAGIKTESGIVTWIDNCSTRSCGEEGIFLSSTSDSTITGVDNGKNGRHGILVTGNGNEINGGESYLNTSQNVRITGKKNRVIGHRANNANQAGIALVGSEFTTVSGCVTPNNGGTGVLCDGSLRSTITGCQMMDERTGTEREQTHGVQEVNSADYTVVSGCIATNHITADYDVTGTNSSVN